MQKTFDLIFHGRGGKAIVARIVFVLLCVVLIGGILFVAFRWPEGIIILFVSFVLIALLGYIIQYCIDLINWIKHGD